MFQYFCFQEKTTLLFPDENSPPLNITITITYHKNNNEDETYSHNDQEGDQVVFQRQAEVRQEDHMTSVGTHFEVKREHNLHHVLAEI